VVGVCALCARREGPEPEVRRRLQVEEEEQAVVEGRRLQSVLGGMGEECVGRSIVWGRYGWKEHTRPGMLGSQFEVYSPPALYLDLTAISSEISLSDAICARFVR
jgi:hypothetical protein